jgi:ABC-type transport system involved in Fe-S cluster assembly fused permease/ATPase subunit
MQDGRVQERGNHIGLLAKGGIYKKLVELQAF